ncbi:RagB/SusD family nutrient uptake outer membrane protein [Bacteroides sp.]|uniref:RagB/SusD family nutrient uptake outer membrane protein n=1 Tax=Bacteroides sp. TaxID=29523 RepID=UPI00262EC9D3|nr:RagB/SusD family nutrient uptake outer membrane protein [Bacteroides sp.]
MKKHHFTYVVLTILLSSLVSCEDMLTEDPDSFYKKEQYFTSESKAEMSIYSIYESIASKSHYGGNEMAPPASDDTYYINGVASDNTRRDIAHYNLTSANTWIQEIWMYKYQGIDRANYAIDGIQNMNGYSENKNLQRLVAEARFLRAFLSFDLIKYWGDVPFKTTYSADYESAFGGRINRETIYDEIIKDLNFAKETLDWANAETSPERATQGAARALLMRVYLQRAGYSLQQDGTLTRPDDAKRNEYFKAVIEEWKIFKAHGYHDFYSGGYTELFKSFSGQILNSQESLLEVALHHVSGSLQGNGLWGTYNGPEVDAPGILPTEADKFMGRANAFFRVVPEWKDFFEENDTRRDVMVCIYMYKWDAKDYKHKKVENKSNKWYPGKWRREWMPIGFSNPNSTNVNYCVLRYADVVLMAAEAYNETGDTPQAWILLNSVRTRSGATPITNANYKELLKAPKVYDLPFIQDGDDQGKFRTALYWERGFELAFEGQRKYDLIRWGILKEALEAFGSKSVLNKPISKSDAYPAYKNFTSGKHELFPIPLKEMQSNPKLEGKNNPGY